MWTSRLHFQPFHTASSLSSTAPLSIPLFLHCSTPGYELIPCSNPSHQRLLPTIRLSYVPSHVSYAQRDFCFSLLVGVVCYSMLATCRFLIARICIHVFHQMKSYYWRKNEGQNIPGNKQTTYVEWSYVISKVSRSKTGSRRMESDKQKGNATNLLPSERPEEEYFTI